MPLRRAEDAYNPLLEGVDFPMTDGRDRIVFRVSREALDDRASLDGNGHLDHVEAFLLYRQAIELIASNKYDAGDPDRIIRSVELTAAR